MVDCGHVLVDPYAAENVLFERKSVLKGDRFGQLALCVVGVMARGSHFCRSFC